MKKEKEKEKPDLKYPLCKIVKRVLLVLKNKKKWFWLLFVLILVYGSLFPFIALLLSQIMIALINEDFSTSDLIIGLFIVLAATAFISAFLVQFLFQYLGTFITTDLRKKAFSAILRKSVSWHDKPEHSSGAMSGMLAKDATKIQGASTRGVGNLMQFLVAFIAGVIIAILGEWRIGLILTGLSPLILWGAF